MLQRRIQGILQAVSQLKDRCVYYSQISVNNDNRIKRTPYCDQHRELNVDHKEEFGLSN